MVKYLIFDLDGTIIDTVEDIRASVNKTLGEYGFPPITTLQATSFIGKGTDHLLKEALSLYDSGHIDYPVFKARYMENQNALTPTFSKAYPKIAGLLSRLHGKNIRTFVFSNKPHHLARLVVTSSFPDMFIDIEGHHFHELPKPDITAASRFIKRNGIIIDECLWVGDSAVDIKTARNLNMKCVAVTWGYQDKAVLSAEKPDFMIDEPEGLLKIIDMADRAS